MSWLLLLDGLSYMYTRPGNGGIMHFQRAIPKEVGDEEDVQTLMATGRFESVPEMKDIEFGDTDMTVRFTGTIGDAVVTANCLAAVKRQSPDYFRIMGLVAGTYRRIVQAIAKDIDLQKWFVRGRGKRHVDLGLAARTSGEGFDWERGIAGTMGFKEYPEPPEEIVFKQIELQKARYLLRNREKDKLVVLQVWTDHSRSKSYEPRKVGELINIVKDMGYDCVVIGQRGEPRYNAEFIDVRGVCSIIESAAVLSQADLVVSVDSWVWHMAKLLGIPQVVLFGSLKPEGKARPWETVRVLRGKLCEGKKCNVYSCSNSQCIDSIEVDSILSAVEEVVEESLAKVRKPKPVLMDREAIMGVRY